MGLILDEDVDFERDVNASSFSFLLSTPRFRPALCKCDIYVRNLSHSMIHNSARLFNKL